MGEQQQNIKNDTSSLLSLVKLQHFKLKKNHQKPPPKPQQTNQNKTKQKQTTTTAKKKTS